jgi:hypothetical protein
VYFWLADRFSEGHDVLELAVAAASPVGASVAPRVEMLLALSYAGPEDEDGERATPRTHGTVAFGVAVSGDDEHAAALADEARVGLEELEGHWAAGMRSRFDARSAGGSDPAATAESVRRAGTIADGSFEVAGLLLEAWIAERREEQAQAVAGYRHAFDLARRASFEHELSPLAAGTARRLWSSAHARAELGRAQRALGRTMTAQALHRRVVDWSRTPRPQQPRETFLAALAGTPAAAVLSPAVEAAS